MRKLEKIDENTLLVSPYAGTVKFDVTRFTNYKQFKKDEDILLPVEYFADKQEHTKMYRSLNNSQMLMFLSYRALQLFIWVTLHIQKDKDWVQINEQLFCKRASISTGKTYKAALSELLRYQLLIPTHYKTVYWVNPEYIFNGDRLKKYPNNLNITEL